MSIWTAIGWLGNGCYFSRFLWQWLASERARRSVTPSGFWWLSLGGCLLLGSYAVHAGALVLLPAFLINGAIYVRNVFLQRRREMRARLGPIPAALLGLGAGVVLVSTGAAEPREGLGESVPWLAVGVTGQLAWGTRFILQWLLSERAGHSYFPLAFWWFSLFGALANLLYASHLGDPVFIASYAPAPIYPVRNLWLARVHARRRTRPS